MAKRLSKKIQKELSEIENYIRSHSLPYLGTSRIIGGGVMTELEKMYPEAMEVYLDRERRKRWKKFGVNSEEEYLIALDKYAEEMGWKREGE